MSPTAFISTYIDRVIGVIMMVRRSTGGSSGRRRVSPAHGGQENGGYIMRDAKGKFCKANFKIGDIVEGLGYASPVRYEGRFLGYYKHGEGIIEDPGKGPWYVKRGSIKLVRTAEDDALNAAIRERDEAREEVDRLSGELDDMRVWGEERREDAAVRL